MPTAHSGNLPIDYASRLAAETVRTRFRLCTHRKSQIARGARGPAGLDGYSLSSYEEASLTRPNPTTRIPPGSSDVRESILRRANDDLARTSS